MGVFVVIVLIWTRRHLTFELEQVDLYKNRKALLHLNPLIYNTASLQRFRRIPSDTMTCFR